MLEGKKNGRWQFRLRFADHEGLSAFHDNITAEGTQIEIGRSYDVSEATDPVHQFDLTPSQREALVLALQEGDFASPSRVDLDELADDLGISRQAVSTRIRKGNEQILRENLL